MLVMAGFFIWGGIAIVGVPLVILTFLVVGVDSWANRPVKRSAARYRDDDY